MVMICKRGRIHAKYGTHGNCTAATYEVAMELAYAIQEAFYCVVSLCSFINNSNHTHAGIKESVTVQVVDGIMAVL